MSLALELLERRKKVGGVNDQLCESNNSDELFAFLQQDYERQCEDETEYDEGKVNDGLIDCYVKRLDDTVKLGKIGYNNGKKETFEDSVELNILIEKSLLEYELKVAEKREDGNRKKYVFDVDHLVEVLNKRDSSVDGDDLLVLKHYVELLKLGYAPDLPRIEEESNSSENILMDELVSTLLSLAVQKNIYLPSPDSKDMRSIDGRIEWFKECIYKVVSSGGSGGSGGSDGNNMPAKKDIISTEEDEGEEDINEDKRALKDLQFAHSYLTKKYEEEVSQHGQYVNELIQKYKQCEDLLQKSNFELTKVTNQQLKLELENAELRQRLDGRTKEVHELQMQNNLLRVDCLGLAAGAAGAAGATVVSPPASEGLPPVTPLSAAHSAHSAQSDSVSVHSTPSADEGNPPASPSPSVSVRILRMEFKKLVEGINLRFARELEKLERERGGSRN